MGHDQTAVVVQRARIAGIAVELQRIEQGAPSDENDDGGFAAMGASLRGCALGLAAIANALDSGPPPGFWESLLGRRP